MVLSGSMLRAAGYVVLLSLAVLLVRAAVVGLDGDYVDPVSKITAQDEVLYAHSAIQMAEHGNWLTPMFLGRLALYKPPLLAWTSGLSARILGISRISLRLPNVLLVSLALGLIFLWAAEVHSWQAGVCAAVLVLSDHLWNVLGAMSMTDGLLAAFLIAALFCLFSDPWLESRWSLWGFGAATACAILAKSIAGALPLVVLSVYWLVAPRKARPQLSRVIGAGAIAVGLAAPWFLYQLAIHRRWFLAETLGLEIMKFGTGQPPQTSAENHFLFYWRRLALMDPVLIAAATLALPQLFAALRRRSAEATLLACWLAVTGASVFCWQYRNASYLLPLVPALAIAACAYARPIFGTGMLVVVGAVVAVKLVFPATTWGMSLRPGTIQAAAPAITRYCDLGRGNELVIVGVADDLFASTLPLPKLRYALEGPAPADSAYAMPFASMGVAVSAAQFDDLARWQLVFHRQLEQWGIHTDEPIATLIQFPSVDGLASMVAAHPKSDFFLPQRYRNGISGFPTHEIVPQGSEFFLLLSHDRLPRTAPPAWTCHL